MLDLKKYKELYKLNEDDGNWEPIEDLTAEYDALKEINIPELHDFIVEILNEYSDEDKLANANKVFDVLGFMLKERNLYVKGQSFFNILIASCLLYNIIRVNKNNWNDVFEIRNIINNKASKYIGAIPGQAIESICDTIEGQLGEAMPIKGCRPNPNTPGEMFTLAVALTNRYI